MLEKFVLTLPNCFPAILVTSFPPRTSEHLVWYASHWGHLFPDPVPGLTSCPHRSPGPWLRVPSSTLSIFPRLGTSAVLCQGPGQKLMLPAWSHQPIDGGVGSAPVLAPFHLATRYIIHQLGFHFVLNAWGSSPWDPTLPPQLPWKLEPCSHTTDPRAQSTFYTEKFCGRLPPLSSLLPQCRHQSWQYLSQEE